MEPFEDRDIVVVDLGFGEMQEGATVDWLCPDQADLDVAAVVRFNGGAQAAHNVTVGERHHTFSQFGSGTLSGIPTFLSRFVGRAHRARPGGACPGSARSSETRSI